MVSLPIGCALGLLLYPGRRLQASTQQNGLFLLLWRESQMILSTSLTKMVLRTLGLKHGGCV